MGARTIAIIGIEAFLLSLPLVQVALAQARAAIPVVDLMSFESVPVQHKSSLLTSPIRCDSQGGVLFRVLDPGWRPSSSLLRVSSDGRDAKEMQFSREDALRNMSLLDYGFGPDGESYALAHESKGSGGDVSAWLVEFTKDGALRGKTELELPIEARQFAWLNRDVLLISGIQVENRRRMPIGKPAVVLADSNGKFIQRVKLERDIQVSEPKPVAEFRSLTKDERQRINDYNSSIDLTSIVSGFDGRGYLRRGESSLIYVISANGEVQRRIDLVPPGKGAKLIGVQVWQNLLAAQFVSGNPSRTGDFEVHYVILDTTSGEIARHFRAGPPKLQGSMVCYSPDALTLLGAKNGMMEFERVPLK